MQRQHHAAEDLNNSNVFRFRAEDFNNWVDYLKCCNQICSLTQMPRQFPKSSEIWHVYYDLNNYDRDMKHVLNCDISIYALIDSFVSFAYLDIHWLMQ